MNVRTPRGVRRAILQAEFAANREVLASTVPVVRCPVEERIARQNRQGAGAQRCSAMRDFSRSMSAWGAFSSDL